MVNHETPNLEAGAAGAELIPSRANSKGLRLDPGELLSTTDRRIDFPTLESLAGKSVTSVSDLTREQVVQLAKFASLLEITEIAAHHPLDGKLVITAFFEASTRTRLSFESAVLRLDGKIVSVPDGRTTGVAKGESLADIGEMFNTYGDLVVMRHTETDSIHEIRRNLELPLVSAGHGTGEHPTQALVDWYTLLKWRPQLAQDSVPPDQQLHIGIIGTPGSMRAVKSFLYMALLFPSAVRKVTVVSEIAEPLGSLLADACAQSEIEVEICYDVSKILPDLDVVYINSIALLGGSYRKLDARYTLRSDSPLKPTAVVMHPLARSSELDVSLDATPHNLYFAQAASAVFIRQALLISLLGRLNRVPPSIVLLAK